MNYTKSGFNITSWNNVQPLELNMSYDWSSIQASMIAEASSSAGFWYPLIIYSIMTIMFYWSFTEISPFAAFRYTYLRALPLALGLVNLISITMLTIGYTQSFRIVAVFFILNILSSVLVLAIENTQ